MRKLIVAGALASIALAGPAAARDGAMYVGVDGGVMKPDRLDLRYVSSATSVGDAIRLRHHVGYDLDALAGYDFGMFRVEGELGYKRAKLKDAEIDHAALAAILQPNLTTHYVANGTGRMWSAMINALLDVGPQDGFNGSIGIGAGVVRAKYRAGLVPSNALNFDGSDSALAIQGIAEVRVPIGANLDAGLKYRYFRTDRFRFGTFCQTTCGSLNPYDLKARYTSNSLLASLVYNFGGVAPAVPPPPPPPPAPPPPPPTQTCPDGSVIDATATCPAPPPPPLPPPPAPERGE